MSTENTEPGRSHLVADLEFSQSKRLLAGRDPEKVADDFSTPAEPPNARGPRQLRAPPIEGLGILQEQDKFDPVAGGEERDLFGAGVALEDRGQLIQRERSDDGF